MKQRTKAKQPSVHPSKLLIAGLLALGAAYIFASVAIDRGNWAYYGLAFAGIYFGLKYLGRFVLALKK